MLPFLGSILRSASGKSVGAIIASVATTATTAAAGSLISSEATLAISGVASAAFPPLGAIILGVAIGALSIGAILFLISKLWEREQFKAIQYLTHRGKIK